MTNDVPLSADHAGSAVAMSVLNAIQNPVVMVNEAGLVAFANWEAEAFFGASASHLARYRISTFIPFGSPLLALIDQVRERRAPINEYRVDLSSPRLGQDKLVDIYVAPVVSEPGSVVIVFQERSMADKIDRQLTHRAAARSVTGLASMLAHEIKNPLSGIRGAAQLLEQSADDEDRALTRLICDETDRIVSLVDRMEVFSDERPVDRVPVNIHSVLDHVKAVARAGFARHLGSRRATTRRCRPYMPTATSSFRFSSTSSRMPRRRVGDRPDGEIVLTTAYRPGIRLSVAGTREKISLPLEFCVQDNGPGVPSDLLPHLFDPFITTKTNGSGLGLALVAKIIGDHGGIIECDSQSNKTTFRVLMPASKDASLEDATIMNPTGPSR
jgi:two-component system nitrogen regulation sensor histidine kinase GlnL